MFTSVYGYPSVCVYYSIAWKYKYSFSDVWIINGILTQISIRRHTLLFLLWRNRTEPNRETEAENTGKRERERTIWAWRGSGIERWWHRFEREGYRYQGSGWQQAAHTGLRKQVQCCLSAALQRLSHKCRQGVAFKCSWMHYSIVVQVRRMWLIIKSDGKLNPKYPYMAACLHLSFKVWRTC